MVKKRMLKLFVCVLAIGLCVSLANADITSDLVAHWKLDEGSDSTAFDSSTIFSNDMSVVGTASWDTGIVGDYSLDFDGGRAYTTATADYGAGGLMADGQLTISFWVRHDLLATDYSQNYLAFVADSSNFIELKRWDTGRLVINSVINGTIGWASFTAAHSYINDNEWHHVAIVMNLSTFDFYVDGVYSNSSGFPIVSDLVGDPYFAIATRRSWGQFPLMGAMDDVRLYNRVLTAEEIAELLTVAQYPPVVDAGPLQSLLWPGSAVTLQMNATATDDGNPIPPGALTYTWSQISGPKVGFDACDIKDPCVTFPVIGVYELQFSADDDDKTTNDTVIIRFRTTNKPMAHWNMDEATGLTAFDSANDNDGTLTGDVVPSRVTGWVGSGALEFYGVYAEDEPNRVSSYVDVTTDVTSDPNMDTLEYEVTLAAWFKINDLANAYHPAIIATSSTGWRLYVETPDNDLYGKVTFTPGDTLSGSRAYSTMSMDDGYWHHVVGIYDGSKSYLYVDGLLDVTVDISGLLDTTDSVPVTIGARNKKDPIAAERSWSGMIDDAYVYDYAIDASQVAALTARGSLVPEVDAGQDQTFYIQYGSLQLNAKVTDDGNPVPAMLAWTQTSGPGIVGFSDTTIKDPTVTFPEAETYDLTLTADDTTKVVSDTVTITVKDPTCDNVIHDDGGWRRKTADISGPEGVPDCYVDLHDFAAIAGNWLYCNDPQDNECDFLFF